MRVVDPTVRLVWVTPNPEEIIETSGRICYKSVGSSDAEPRTRFIQSLIQRQHESVIEHASASFDLVTNRGISHELVRHRLASYSQESTRYCNYSRGRFGNEIAVLMPSKLNLYPALKESWYQFCCGAEALYFDWIEKGVPLDLARDILPMDLATTIRMTANFREWRHLLGLRLAPAAHPDMRILVQKVGRELFRCAPSVFYDFEEILNEDLSCCSVRT